MLVIDLEKTSKNLLTQLIWKMLSNLCGCNGKNENMIKNIKLKDKTKGSCSSSSGRQRRYSSGRRWGEEENKLTASKFPTLVLIYC